MVSFVKKKKAAMQAGMEIVHRLSDVSIYSTVLFWSRIPTLPEAETHPEPPIWHTDGEPPSVCGVVVLDDFHHGKNSISSH